MKRYLLVGLLVLAVNLGFAKKVDLETVKTVGKAFYYEQLAKNDRATSLEGILIKEVHTLKTNAGEDFIYVMNMEPKGFILVSGDNIFRPVLGYGFDEFHNPEVKNHNFYSWTRSYIEEYEYCLENGLEANAKFESDWEKYNTTDASNLTVNDRNLNVVEPILTNIWNQDYPYNILCPEDEDGPGGHVYAGCVATAMSMIMYHYKYPEVGSGSHTHYMPQYGSMTANYGETYYQWDAMTDNAVGYSDETLFAIGQIQYHCGISVDMNYSPDGSGSYSWKVPNAIKTYFNYDQSADHQERGEVASWDAWRDVIYEQLDAAHPLYYSGQSDDGGHAFCCDGYDDNEMFHFNFGWGSSSNGFYVLTGSDDAVGGFDSYQAVVKNFFPATDSNYPYHCSGAKDLAYGSGTIGDGSGPIETYQNNADCSWLIKPVTEFDSVQSIKIEFMEMDLESGADMVTIYNGATTDAEVVGTYSGTDIPDIITIDNDHVLVTFESDGNDASNQGFRLEYKTVKPSFCGSMTEFTDASGTFGDGSEDKNYVNSTICQFKIAPEGASTIELNFTEFNLGDQGDLIEVYQVNPTQQIAVFKGGDTPTQVVGATGEMILIFKTDSYNVDQGFEVEYSSDVVSVGNIDIFNDLRIYPNPANTQIEVSFNLENANNADLQIMDLTGKVVYSTKIESVDSRFYNQIQVSEFSKGVYFMNILTEKGSIREKIIVQ